MVYLEGSAKISTETDVKLLEDKFTHYNYKRMRF